MLARFEIWHRHNFILFYFLSELPHNPQVHGHFPLPEKPLLESSKSDTCLYPLFGFSIYLKTVAPFSATLRSSEIFIQGFSFLPLNTANSIQFSFFSSDYLICIIPLVVCLEGVFQISPSILLCQLTTNNLPWGDYPHAWD